MRIYARVFFYILNFCFLLSCSSGSIVSGPDQVSPSDKKTLAHSSEYYHQMALGYSQQGQSAQSIEQFRQALKTDSQNVTLHLELGAEYRKAGLNHLAYYEFSEVLRVKNDDERALAGLAAIYVESKIYSKAEGLYQKLLQLKPGERQYLWAVFYLEKAQNHFNEALSRLAQVSSAGEDQYKVSFEKALIYKQLNKKNLYEQHLNEAYQLNSRDRMTVLEMTSFLFKQKKYQTAVDILKSYTETHDFDLEISENLSYAALRTKNNELAQKEFDRQRLWAKDHIDVNIKKGQIYLLDE